MSDTSIGSTLTRRELMQGVVTLLGGSVLVGGDALLEYRPEPRALDAAFAQGVGDFTADQVALLDEIAETILPETSTPGAKAAKTGAFMALMVTDVYTERDRRAFREGLSQLDAACRALHKTGFMQASPAQRLALLERLDREQQTAMDARATAPRSRAPVAVPAPAENQPAAHYFRMMKELALLGFFTSEVGYTKAMRYVESPGRFDPCAPHAPGDKTWASHA